MKSFYYNIDDAEFIDPAGERIPRCVPELFYQEMAEWRIFLRDRENRPRDLSSIVGWSAAVDCDYSGDSAPMCRTLSDGITADPVTGAVTVRIDAATAEFLAAVDGSRQRRAFFELYGVNATGERELYLGFEISARMILDAAPGTPQEVPETFATRLYVDLTVGSAAAAVSETLGQELAERTTGAEARTIASAVVASGGYVNGSGARVIAEDVMSSGGGQSGAVVSGAEFNTTVGPYTVALTSGGGLAISGSGASVVLSGGEIAASATDGEDNEAHATITSGGVTFGASDATNDIGVNVLPGEISVFGNDNTGGVAFSVNSRSVATQLVTSTVADAGVWVQVLSGGTSIVCTSPLEGISVDSVVKTTEASYIHFTLDSVTLPTPVVISGVSYLNSATFEGGKEYLVGFFDGMAVVNEVTP